MRRLRPLRRRRRERESERDWDDTPETDEAERAEPEASEADAADLLPFVPVTAAGDRIEDYAPPPDDATPAERAPRRRGLRLRAARPRLGLGVRWDVLLVLALLVAGGIVGTLVNLDRAEVELPDWWPAAMIALAVLWLVVALIRRQVTPALGAAALAGVGISALLETQSVAAFRETLLGITLVTLGLGIVLRGLLLRQRPAR